MDNKFSRAGAERENLIAQTRLLLVAVLAAAAATGALALFQPSASPAGSPAAVSRADVPQSSLARERAEEHQFRPSAAQWPLHWLPRRSASKSSKDRWLERGGTPNEGAAQTEREMFEQHRFLAQRSEAAAANDVAAPTEREMFERQHRFLAQQK